MEVYEVLFDPTKDMGIYALSVVNDPAMESHFIALSKEQPQKVQLAKVDEEQRILLGVALIPDKPIKRIIEDREVYITFPKKTIREAAHTFLKNQYNNNSSLEHEVKLNGMTVVESWMVDNPELDKTKHYGLEAPEGSWVAAMKVDDETVWNEYVKTGKVKGFSIDALFSLNKLELNKEQMSDKKTIAQEIKEGFQEIKNLFLSKEEKQEDKSGNADSETKVELAKAVLEDGSEIEFEGDEIVVGTAITIDGEPAPDGELVLEDGRKLTIAEGAVSEISVEVDEEASLEEIKEALAKLSKDVKAELAKKDEELSKKDTEIQELKTQLSKEPAKKPLKNTTTQLSKEDYEKLTPLERYRLSKKA